MSIRESINNNSTISIIVIVAASGLAVAATAWEFASPSRDRGPDRVFFTTDDGKTYFADSSKLVAPFDHDGKEAVQSFVYRCSKTQFVGYLMKYSLQGKTELEKAHAAGMASIGLAASEVLVKKPGDASWVDQAKDKSRTVLQVTCPDDPNAGVEAVTP